MTDIMINADNIYDAARKAFRDFLKWSARKIKKLMKWIADHPQETAMIIVAIAQASMGNLSGLREIGLLVLGA